METSVYEKLSGVLLPWYYVNHRELPWRKTKEPYHVWLSEIMLQQTRVEAVKGYYERFLTALPTVEALASCDGDLLHKLWEGLGYYSRVRNLKKAAQVIVGEYGGVFPGEYKKVLALPGIGEYTAGAICSICFDLPTPAVDGNVLRLATRLTDDPAPIDTPEMKRKVKTALAEVYPKAAGDFTQALMELGATVCGPNREPDCESCPCEDFCKARQRGTQKQLPVKLPKRAKKQEDRTVFIFSCADRFALQKRGDSGLLASMWQFPNVLGALDIHDALAEAEKLGLRPVNVIRMLERKHIFTHIRWDMKGYFIEVAEPLGDFQWRTAEEIENEAALPTAFRQFWEARRDV